MIKHAMGKKRVRKLHKSILRRLRSVELKTNLFYRTLSKIKPISTPGQYIWINPMEINEVGYNFEKYDLLKTLSLVKGGDWDRRRRPFESMALNQAFKAHFEDGVPFDQTDFYNPEISTTSQKDAMNGTNKWEFITAFDYENRVAKIDDLFISIKEDGYKSQKELNGILHDEVRVRITREGHILFENSIHRMAIAKILELTKIPAIVTVRHAHWMAFKMQLIAFSKRTKNGSAEGGKLYQMPHHPDLQDIPYVHNNIERFDAIKHAVKNTSGSVLDIGANFGYFSHCFEELGYQCTAVELDPEINYFLEKLKKAENRHFEIWQGSVLELIHGPTTFDIVVALNIFHHFLKKETSYLSFINLLKNLDMNEMFFEPHNPEERPFQSAYKNLNNQDFINLILKHTPLNHYKKILDCKHGRFLYHLWK